jgi:4-amino-4-deoxy-L-arabinose transferase-like glycosyltransferase|tara:strand:+ start:435 stop:1829 length:1395 start_codon:yes stop_codon:yes gene_type:complete
MGINIKNLRNLFYIFLAAHLIVWTAIPTLTNNNLPLDTIEALAWGSNLDWGFNKHPPMSAFVVEIFYQIFGPQDWAYYLLSQIFVIISFFVVFKFAEDFFENKFFSLLSVLLLEGIYFYNYTTPEFNVYVCELPFWSLTALYCWKGLKDNKIIDWLLFGVFAAAGILSHYLFIYLLVAMDVFFLYMIIKKKINFKCLISLVPFLIVLLPHLIWLTENNYITVTYGLHRTGTGEQNLFDHIIHPLIFLGKQIGILIPFFLMLLFLASKFKNKISFKDDKLLFLIAINILPIILVFLTSMIMGVKIRTMWMTPFYLFFGVLIIYIFQSKINLKKLKGFASVFIILFIFSPFAYAYVSITQTEKRTDYPGREIANKIQIEWDKNFKDEIQVVVGNEWSAGNLSYHLKSRPIWTADPFDNLDRIKDETSSVVFYGLEFKCVEQDIDDNIKVLCVNIDLPIHMMGKVKE